MQQETTNSLDDQLQHIEPQKKVSEQSDNSLFKGEKVESFDSLLIHETNFSIPSLDVPASLNQTDIASKQ